MNPTGIIKGFTSYFIAVKLLFKNKTLFRFSLLPFFINLIVLSLVLYFGLSQYTNLLNLLLPNPETWWQVMFYWLSWILIPVVFILILFYCFIGIATIISSPFLEMLSSKYLTIKDPSKSYRMNLSNAKIIWEESKKIIVLLLLALITFPLNYIPVIGNILYFTFGSILISFDFIDYPMSVAEWPFKKRYQFILKHFFISLGFGSATFILFFVPIIGFFCLPLATLAATYLFDELKGSA